MARHDPDVLDALRRVRDPRLRRSIVDLGLVRGVGGIKRGRVSVKLGLLDADPRAQAQVRAEATRALAALSGVDSVNIEFEALGPDELAAVRDRLVRAGDGAATTDGKRAVPFNQPGSRTRVLGISSGKGGVGKSSVTVNTAIALARLGREVAILDADVYGFSIPRMLGVGDEGPIALGDLLIPPVGHGVACISTGFFVEDDAAVIWRGPMLHKALEQFLVDVWWGDLDYLLVDMPPGTGDVALSMAQYVPRAEIYVVTTPQPAAQRVAQRTAAMARKLNLDLRGVVENMSWFTGDDGKRYDLFGAGGGADLAAKLDVPLLAQVPLVPELREGGDVGLPITVSDPESEAGAVFTTLAGEIERIGPKRIYRSELTLKG